MFNRGCNRSAIVDSWPKLREEGTVCRIHPSPMKELSMVEHVKKKGFNLQVEKVYEKKKFERKTKDFYGTGSEKKVTTLSKELAHGGDYLTKMSALLHGECMPYAYGGIRGNMVV